MKDPQAADDVCLERVKTTCQMSYHIHERDIVTKHSSQIILPSASLEGLAAKEGSRALIQALTADWTQLIE